MCAKGAVVCYSCLCSRTRNSSSAFEGVNFGMLAVTFVLSLIWLYCWCVLNNSSADINEFLFDELKNWFHWYILILIFSICSTLYVFIVLCCGCVALLAQNSGNSPNRFYLAIGHKITIFLCFCFYIGGMCMLSVFWPDNEVWSSVSVSFEITGPLLQLITLIFLVYFLIYVCMVINSLHNSLLKSAVFFIYFATVIFILTIPYWLYSPCIRKDVEKMIKPKVIGHRGAPAVAPENTMLSFQKAVECGVYAFESDVRISADGIPFLMHDSSLYRTTNVAEVFPSRKYDRAETFSWSELSQLNAGQWFLDFDPFLYKMKCDKSCRGKISSQKIPLFEEWVSFAATTNKTIVFDLFKPPADHLNRTNYQEGIIEVILRSGISQRNVIWPLSFLPDHTFIKSVAPGFRLMAYEVVLNASAYDISTFNLPYMDATKNVLTLNYSVIEYVVDTPLTYSRAWCQCAWSVTTNQCQLLSEMKKPSWSMNTTAFYTIWVLAEIASIIAMLLLCFYFSKQPEYEMVRVGDPYDDDKSHI